ncbi:MAG TPA: phosphoribosylanthranilate isomerase [Acidimicrobiia bacterium]|nr:phosphoribosylanthranilate isomerase [Acidimicrobiia bacterium]
MWVKICGITNEEDALLTVALGADALGFNLAPGSPRQVTPETIGEILHRLPPGIVTVGVFRDEQRERVVEIVNTLGLGGAQLSGREPLSDVRWIRQRVPFVIQGFPAGDPALAAVANGPVDIVLIDADEPGSGTTFDWALADAVPAGVRLLLAGGLHPGNVAQAIRRVRPWGVDVATGVETSPGSGHKDPRKLRAFIRAAREAMGDELDEGDWAPDPDPQVVPYDWMSDGA